MGRMVPSIIRKKGRCLGNPKTRAISVSINPRVAARETSSALCRSADGRSWPDRRKRFSTPCRNLFESSKSRAHLRAGSYASCHPPSGSGRQLIGGPIASRICDCCSALRQLMTWLMNFSVVTDSRVANLACSCFAVSMILDQVWFFFPFQHLSLVIL